MSAVRDVMIRHVETVAPEDSIESAALRMKALDVGSLPVCEAHRRLVGILTDRDIAVRVVARGLSPGETHVAEAMTAAVTYCGEDEDIEAVLQVMGEDQVRRLPVVRDGRLVGIVALSDLAERPGEQVGRAVREISSPVDELPS